MTEDMAEVIHRCDNAGRWGAADDRGTLNLITPEKRIAAAALVRLGVVVPMGKAIDTVPGPSNPRPAWHQMHLETERPYACADSLHVMTHGFGATHVDALGHMSLDGRMYNDRRQLDAVTGVGLAFGGIEAVSDGVFTRGLLLDVAATRGVSWLAHDDIVTADDLEAACRLAGVTPAPGDALVVHVGLEAREAVLGPEDPRYRAGLDVSAVLWLRDQDIAVYTGDCMEAFPATDHHVEMPLHQLGLARMGLHLIDCPTLSRLVATCLDLRRSDFLFVSAPLRVEGGTGSLVNPLAIL